MHRAAAGEDGAAAEVIDRYGGLVWSLARRFCGNVHDAEDAVQEIFLELWSSASRFDPERGAESTFIATIARRRLIDRRRKAQRRPAPQSLPPDPMTTQPDDGGRDHTDRVADRDEAARVLEAISQLSEEQQNAIKLSIYDGCSHSEIAEKLSMPIGTVKTHIRRGLIRVREALGLDGVGAAGTEVRP